MRESENDPRVVRSRALMRAALMQLAAEKSFASLNVQDVTARAGLNRTTFYLHYKGMHELLEDCIRALFDEMRHHIYARKPAGGDWHSTQIEPIVEAVFQHLAEHKDFYRAMLGEHGDPYFRSLFQELLSELIFEPIAEGLPAFETNQRFEITLQFFTSGFTGVAAWWLEKGMPLSPIEAARQVTTDLLPDYLHLLDQFAK